MTTQSTYLDTIRNTQPGLPRIEFLKQNFDSLCQAETSMLNRGGVRAANTTSATITTSLLNEVVTTTLQDQLAPLQAFSRDFTTDPIKPKATVVSKKITAGGPAQKNATDFEDETNMVATAGPISVTVDQYTAGGHLTNAELNSGYRLEDWAVIKASEIANAIWDVVSALFTSANFTNTPFPSSSAAFSADDMATLWGMVQKATTKNLVVDGPYFARLFGKSLIDFNGASGDVRAVRWPGWGIVGYSTRWSAAGAGVAGIACGPQVLRLVSGSPLAPASAARAGLEATPLMLPIGIPVQVNSWFGLAKRTDWATFDLMFGAALDDPTAGLLILGS